MRSTGRDGNGTVRENAERGKYVSPVWGNFRKFAMVVLKFSNM